VRLLPALFLLIALVCPHDAQATIQLEKSAQPDNVETRTLIARLENVLTQTEKRIREVFGFKLDLKAVIKPSRLNYDFVFSPPEHAEDAKQAGVLLINSRIVRDWPVEDLKLAAGRALYQAVWPGFRKSTAQAPVMVQRMYEEGMTAYAAELLYPGAPKWKYVGLFGREGKEQYRQYLSDEKDLAAEALQALSAGNATAPASRLFPGQGSGLQPRPASGRLLSYRLMKTFEKDLDPKMIQLMQIAEFEQRMKAGLEVLRQGFQGKGGR
jgi:hypothetical protein